MRVTQAGSTGSDAPASIVRAYPPLCLRVLFFFQAEDGIRDVAVTGVQTCALPIFRREGNTGGRDIASTHWTCEVKDLRHAWNLHAREPGDPTNARHEAVGGPVEEEIGRASGRGRG